MMDDSDTILTLEDFSPEKIEEMQDAMSIARSDAGSRSEWEHLSTQTTLQMTWDHWTGERKEAVSPSGRSPQSESLHQKVPPPLAPHLHQLQSEASGSASQQPPHSTSKEIQIVVSAKYAENAKVTCRRGISLGEEVNSETMWKTPISISDIQGPNATNRSTRYIPLRKLHPLISMQAEKLFPSAIVEDLRSIVKDHYYSQVTFSHFVEYPAAPLQLLQKNGTKATAVFKIPQGSETGDGGLELAWIGLEEDAARSSS